MRDPKEYPTLRFRNDRGGHDLTLEGWDEAVEIQQALAAKTAAARDALRDKGRSSVDFKTSYADMLGLQARQLQLVGGAIGRGRN